MNFTNYLCQIDNCIVEEAKNLIVESASVYLFGQQSQHHNQQQQQQQEGIYESIYSQLLNYWLNIFDDIKNNQFIHIIYLQALNTIKTMFISSGKCQYLIYKNTISQFGSLKLVIIFKLNGKRV